MAWVGLWVFFVLFFLHKWQVSNNRGCTVAPCLVDRSQKESIVVVPLELGRVRDSKQSIRVPELWFATRGSYLSPPDAALVCYSSSATITF